jgi:hypothetical protein
MRLLIQVRSKREVQLLSLWPEMLDSSQWLMLSRGFDVEVCVAASCLGGWRCCFLKGLRIVKLL